MKKSCRKALGTVLCNKYLVTCAVIPQKQTHCFTHTVCALQGILSSGIQPLAVCQSMDHGRTVQAVTTDTFFFSENVPWAKK